MHAAPTNPQSLAAAIEAIRARHGIGRDEAAADRNPFLALLHRWLDVFIRCFEQLLSLPSVSSPSAPPTRSVPGWPATPEPAVPAWLRLWHRVSADWHTPAIPDLSGLPQSASSRCRAGQRRKTSPASCIARLPAPPTPPLSPPRFKSSPGTPPAMSAPAATAVPLTSLLASVHGPPAGSSDRKTLSRRRPNTP